MGNLRLSDMTNEKVVVLDRFFILPQRDIGRLFNGVCHVNVFTFVDSTSWRWNTTVTYPDQAQSQMEVIVVLSRVNPIFTNIFSYQNASIF